MILDFTEVPWAPLAWCAQIDIAETRTSVVHGPSVEIRPRWFCEGTWDGPFENGSFSTTDCFFGSGAILDRGGIKFVSSCAPMERLYDLRIGDTHFVSNSLPCLLAQAQADFDPCYATFEEESFSVTKGIDVYAQTFPTSKGQVRMTICRDLEYLDGGIGPVDKSSAAKRLFPDYQTYKSFLHSSLSRIAANMQSEARGHKYSYISGISTGYDSPAICAIARKSGLKEAFTFTRARGDGDDDGSQIGEGLGLKVHRLDRYSWKEQSFPEVPFLVAVGLPSGIELAGADALLRGKVYLSGSFGDEIWGVDTEAEKIKHYKRKEHTGLDLSEFRLQTGFIHIPVPYLGYGAMGDILQISKSDNMKPWDHSNTPYEKYSRPIPRRIIEEAGIPRSGFAREKRAATYGDFETNLTRSTLRQVYRFNHQHCSNCSKQAAPIGHPSGGWGPFQNKWRRPFSPTLAQRALFAVIAGSSKLLVSVGSQSFRGSGRIKTLGRHVQAWRAYEFSFNRCFAWALHKTVDVYRVQATTARGDDGKRRAMSSASITADK